MSWTWHTYLNLTLRCPIGMYYFFVKVHESVVLKHFTHFLQQHAILYTLLDLLWDFSTARLEHGSVLMLLDAIPIHRWGCILGPW